MCRARPCHAALALAVLAITLLPALSRSAEVPTQAQPQGALWVAGTMATAGALLAACPAQILQPFARQSRPMRSAIWTAAALATPVYVALKGGMAGGGLVAGYWMLLLSFDAHEATGVLDTGRHGDWWIRPEHVTCERPIELIASAQ